MSKGALDRNRFEAIEAFLLDTMPQEERARFEMELAHDAGLRRETELQRENMLAIELGGLTRVVKEVAADIPREAAPRPASGARPWGRVLRYAAAVALLLAGTLWWLSRPSANERLFAEHFRPDPGLPVPMSLPDRQAGVSGDPAFHDAMVAYKLGDHAEARTKWAPLLQADPLNDTLRYYTALTLLEERRSEEAEAMLEQVANVPSSVFHAKARWYLFLSYLRAGKTDRLASVPLDDDPVYGERVRAVKAELQR